MNEAFKRYIDQKINDLVEQFFSDIIQRWYEHDDQYCFLDYMSLDPFDASNSKNYKFRLLNERLDRGFICLLKLDLSDVEKPKHIPKLSANEQAVNNLKKSLEKWLKKEKSDPNFDPTAIITQLGQDTRIFSSLEDLVVSAELFGICSECDAVRQEEGCLTCISYGQEKPYTT